MVDVVVCGRCGARCWATASACFNCGQGLAPYPAAPYSAQPAGSFPPAALLVLAIVEIGIGVVGILIAFGQAYWTVYRISYDDIGWAVVDMGFGAAYVATSVAGFVLAVGILKGRPWAWLSAHVLSIVLIALIVPSVFLWGLTVLDVIGIVVNLFVLVYLHVNPVRRLLGRRPLF